VDKPIEELVEMLAEKDDPVEAVESLSALTGSIADSLPFLLYRILRTDNGQREKVVPLKVRPFARLRG